MKERFLDEINTSSHREKIDLDHALNRVTFSHIHSKNPVPSSNRISHDGIIVRGEDFRDGLPDTSNWEPVKDYIKASMGSCLPENFDTLIRDEDVKFSADGALEINKIPKQGQGISLKGSNITKSEKIVSKLTTLNPRHLSILRMAGVEEIDVIRKPKVAIIPTGSKISEKADDSKPGYTVDSNSILIKSYLEEWGADPTIYPIVKGSIKDLEAIINNIIKEVDVILIIGGVGRSKSNYNDYTVETVEKMGHVIANGVLISPGRPVMVGFIDDKPVIGVPGPPHAAIVINDEIVRPVIGRLIPHSNQNRPKIKATLMHDYKIRLICERYNRVYVKWNGKNYEAHAIGRIGDTVENFIDANGVVCYSPDREKYNRGETIEVELLYSEEEIKRSEN